jgi:CheY-like chemotaxis protein
MRILVVDDDEDVRKSLVRLLQVSGHTTVEARDGKTGIRAYTEDGPFDAVVTDYQMPYANGVVLIMSIRALNREQKVILVSGDPPQIPDHVKQLVGDFPMLRKPYRSAELLALLGA